MTFDIIFSYLWIFIIVAIRTGFVYECGYSKGWYDFKESHRYKIIKVKRSKNNEENKH